MRIVMAGASGYLGRHLTEHLTRRGHRVTRLVRREPRDADESRWDPYRDRLDASLFDDADAVINLCGIGVADRRWSPAYKNLIRHTRVVPTALLAEAVAAATVPVLLNASAIGWYERGSTPVDESAPHATDFLGETCAAWERAAEPAAASGARVVPLRTGYVLGPDAAMLRRLLPVFKLGLGGRFGTGRQPFPWISLADWLSAIDRVLTDDAIGGPVNLVGPTPATNADFTKALAGNLHRPALFLVPGFALRIVAGEVAVELLSGANAVPKKLRDNGFEYEHQTLDAALRTALSTEAADRTE